MLLFNTLGKKFLLPTLVLSALLFCSLGSFMAINNNASIRTMIHSRGDAIAKFVTKVSAEYFSIFDFQDFEKFVRALESDPEIEFAVFYNADMKPLSSSDKAPKDTSSLIIHERKILDEGGHTLGYLKLGFNNKMLSESLSRNIKVVGVSMTISLFLLSMGIIFIMRKLIIARVNATVNMLQDIAEGEGDLTKRLSSDDNDELGILAMWFNAFVDHVREIIQTVQMNAERVSVASTQLSSTAENLSKETNEQKLQTEQIAAAITEMSQSIMEIVKNASESAESSKNASSIAVKGKAVV